MARYWPPDLDEVIWTALCAGMKRAEVLWKLERGQLGDIGRVKLPKRTYSDKVKRLRDERGEPVPAVPPGQELDYLSEVERQGIMFMGEQIAALRRSARENGGIMQEQHYRRLDTLMRSVAAAKYRLLHPNEYPIGATEVLSKKQRIEKVRQSQDGGATSATDRKILDELAARAQKS